jgi:membrane protein YqaA with SNARE-associated domain
MDIKNDFTSTGYFSYNHKKKKFFGLIYISFFLFIALFIASYIFFLRHMDSRIILFIQDIIGHVMFQLKEGTIFGIVYTAFFGGLFFIYMPLEAFFVRYLSLGYPSIMVFLIYILGMLLSYSINYFVGYRFSNFSRDLIGLKKFYNIKGLINKYGSLLVFLFNAIPFFPSQPLSTLLGVFKYNKVKFYIFFLSGQIIKFTIIIIIYHTVGSFFLESFLGET